MNVTIRTLLLLTATAFTYFIIWLVTWTIYNHPYKTIDSREYECRIVALENPTAERLRDKYEEFRQQGWRVLKVDPDYVEGNDPEVIYYYLIRGRQPGLLEFPGQIMTWIMRIITLGVVVFLISDWMSRRRRFYLP